MGFPCGGSKSESGSEEEGSCFLDIEQSFGYLDRTALSLAAGVSKGVTIGGLTTGGKVGGSVELSLPHRVSAGV